MSNRSAVAKAEAKVIRQIEARGYVKGARAIIDFAILAADEVEKLDPQTDQIKHGARAMRAFIQSAEEMLSDATA